MAVACSSSTGANLGPSHKSSYKLQYLQIFASFLQLAFTHLASLHHVDIRHCSSPGQQTDLKLWLLTAYLLGPLLHASFSSLPDVHLMLVAFVWALPFDFLPASLLWLELGL